MCIHYFVFRKMSAAKVRCMFNLNRIIKVTTPHSHWNIGRVISVRPKA